MLDKSTKATIKTVSKHYITCPYEDCGAEGEEGPGSVTHLLDRDTSFGPWYCEKCHRGVFGNIIKGEVFLDLSKEFDAKSCKPGLSLLRLDPLSKPLFLVIKSFIFNDNIDPDGAQYYYEEGTCPTNIMHDVEVVAIGNDPDPHGLFTYLKTIPHPGEEANINNMDIEELARLFNTDIKLLEGTDND
jgi:hypothetical protein